MTRVTGLAVLILLAVGLPAASAGSHARNAGIVWAQDSAIWGADIDGRNKRIITTFYSRGVPGFFASPAWSPSGQALAYVTAGDAKPVAEFGLCGRWQAGAAGDPEVPGVLRESRGAIPGGATGNGEQNFETSWRSNMISWLRGESSGQRAGRRPLRGRTSRPRHGSPQQ